MQKFLHILKNYRLVKTSFFIYFTAAVLTIVSDLSNPKIFERILSIIENKQPLEQLHFWFKIAVLVVTIKVIFGFIRHLFHTNVWNQLYYAKEKLYRRQLLNIEYKHITDTGTGKIISRLSRGIEAEVNIFMDLNRIFLNAILRSILVFSVFALYLPLYLIVIILFFIIILGVNRYFFPKVKKISKKVDKEKEESTRLLSRVCMESLLIKINNKQKTELKKSNTILNHLPKLVFKKELLNSILGNLTDIFFQFGHIILYFIIAMMVIREEQSIAFLVMVTTYVWYLRWPLEAAIGVLKNINHQMTTYDKLQEFIEHQNDVIDGHQPLNFKQGQIELKNIDFTYQSDPKEENKKQEKKEEKAKKESRPIFKNFSLDFPAGKTTALVGHSGSGKSTIVKLILRLYDPQQGNILIDNQKLTDLQIASVYDKIGYLPQEPAIFDGTIRENLEYAFDDQQLKDYSEDLIWQALAQAQIKEMVEELPDKLETELGEKGVKLSGGEKQRLAIARIFLKNPQILILDEPTSALDSLAESKITEILNQVIENRTVIIIAHRLQTVMSADKIVVIEKGTIEQIGTHQELLTKSEIYKKMVDLQKGVLQG